MSKYLVSNQTQLFSNSSFKIITLEDSLKILQSLDNVSLDTETLGLDCFTKDLLTIQLGNYTNQVVYDINSYSGKVPPKLKEFLNNSNQLFIIQNAKFDLQFLFKQEIIIKRVFDTMLAEQILNNGLQYQGFDLKSLCKKYCSIDLDKSVRGDIITKGLTLQVLEYAAKDVVYLEDIMNSQLKEASNKDLIKAISLDNEFVKVLAYMEFCGIKLDWDKWKKNTHKKIEQLQLQKEVLDQWVIDHNYLDFTDKMIDLFSLKLSCNINWNSSQQVIKFFEFIGINCTIKEKGIEKKTVEEKSLEKYKETFPILKEYFKYKEIYKNVSTYGLNWNQMINPITKRIHTKFNQLMTTGRLSCGSSRENKPNLQNLPSDSQTRSCFIAEDGYKFLSADYSAQESIVLANFSKDKNLLEFYKKGFEDIHSYVTFLLFPEVRRCTLEELTNNELLWIKKNYKEKRNIAKTAESMAKIVY